MERAHQVPPWEAAPIDAWCVIQTPCTPGKHTFTAFGYTLNIDALHSRYTLTTLRLHVI